MVIRTARGSVTSLVGWPGRAGRGGHTPSSHGSRTVAVTGSNLNTSTRTGGGITQAESRRVEFWPGVALQPEVTFSESSDPFYYCDAVTVRPGARAPGLDSDREAAAGESQTER